MNDRLLVAAVTPPGMGHLESPRLADDLTMARDFDMGYSGPPLVIAMDFISSGLVLLATGLASAIVLAAFAWWAPLAAAGRLGLDPLAAAGERGLARPQHQAGARCSAAR